MTIRLLMQEDNRHLLGLKHKLRSVIARCTISTQGLQQLLGLFRRRKNFNFGSECEGVLRLWDGIHLALLGIGSILRYISIIPNIHSYWKRNSIKHAENFRGEEVKYLFVIYRRRRPRKFLS